MISKYWFLSVFLLLLIFIQNENNGAVSGAYRYSYYYRSYYYSSYYSYYRYKSAPYINVTARSSRAYSLSRLGPYYNYYYNLYFGVASNRLPHYMDTKKAVENCLNLEGNVTAQTFLGYFSCPLQNSDPANHTSCCGDSLAQYCCKAVKPRFTTGEIIGIVIGCIILVAIPIGLIFWVYQCYKARKQFPSRSGTDNAAMSRGHLNEPYTGPMIISGATQAPPPYSGIFGPPPPGSNPIGQPPYPTQGGNAAYPPQMPYPPANTMPYTDVTGGSGPPPPYSSGV